MRRTRTLIDRNCINFCSNDYLGLSHLSFSGHPLSCGSASSPLLSGYSPEARSLEEKFCHHLGFESAMLFSSGYQANVGIISGLLGRKSVLLCDRFSHASIIDGGILSRAQILRYRPNDLNHLKELIHQHRPDLVVTESVFSMEGVMSPLLEISEICHQQNIPLMVDDAHGFGIMGQNGLGAVEYWKLKKGKPDILVVPFGKALGASGAIVLSRAACIQELLQKARSYIYSTAISPLLCQAVSHNLERIIKEKSRRDSLKKLIQFFNIQAKARGISLLSNDPTPIRPIFVGDPLKLTTVANHLLAHGYYVGAIRAPTVPKGGERLRVSLNAAITQDQIIGLLDQIKKVLK